MHEVCWRVDSSIRQLKPNNGHCLNSILTSEEPRAITASHRMAALYAEDQSFIAEDFIQMEKTSSVRGYERDRPSRTRYKPIPGRLVADIRVGEQSGKACHALRCGNLDDLGFKDEYTKFVGG